MTKQDDYVPHAIGTATFANGQSYQIDQVNTNGACRVVDLVSNKVVNYAKTIANAWKSVRYTAGINDRTERTTE